MLLPLPAIWWSLSDATSDACREAEKLLATNPNQAAAILEQAVMNAGGNAPNAQLLWTRALIRARRPDEALGCFSLITSPSAVDHGQLLILAEEATASGDFLLARLVLEAIPEKSKARADALERLITVYQQLGDAASAKTMAEELNVLQPQNSAGWLAIAQFQEQQMEPHAALRSYQQILKHERDEEQRRPALQSVVRILVLLGEREDARKYFDELSDNGRLEPDDQLNEVLLLRLEGETESAWQKINSFMATSSGNVQGREIRGTLAFGRGDTEAALKDFQTVVNEQPANKQSHYKLAQALIRLDRKQEAQEHLERNRELTEISARVLQLQSRSETGQAEADRLGELANAYEKLGQRETATRLRASARRIIPGNQ